MSDWKFSESPLIDGDRVVVTPGGADAALVALNKTTGAHDLEGEDARPSAPRAATAPATRRS